MAHSIGLSGSVILSDPSKLRDLFTYEMINHIEIGEFPDEAAFHQFLHFKRQENITYGIHSPLLRHMSKYDLVEKVQFEPEEAWEQFESEVETMARLGAAYILVHFPYFKEEKDTDTVDIIESGLKKFHQLQERYAIPIVCEPKLGHNRSPFGIQALDRFPLETWNKYGIKLCIDVGDYLLATGCDALNYVKKWRDHIKVVHLHHVEFRGEKYIWIPVHPSYEADHSHFQVKKLIKQLAKSPDVFFIFEHTPHSKPTKAFVEEGIQWVKELINN